MISVKVFFWQWGLALERSADLLMLTGLYSCDYFSKMTYVTWKRECYMEFAIFDAYEYCMNHVISHVC